MEQPADTRLAVGTATAALMCLLALLVGTIQETMVGDDVAVL
jgi:hypothetical protein